MNRTKIEKLMTEIESYYSKKIKEFGHTPQGVDWNSKKGQFERFRLLLKYLPLNNLTSILDYGCGYGALLEYIKVNKIDVKYCGYDFLLEMIAEAKKLHIKDSNSFISELPPSQNWDFIILSGVFNVKNTANNLIWENYVLKTIKELIKISKIGISFNILTNNSEIDSRKEHLFYTDPMELISKINLYPPYTVFIDHSSNSWESTVTILK